MLYVLSYGLILKKLLVEGRSFTVKASKCTFDPSFTDMSARIVFPFFLLEGLPIRKFRIYLIEAAAIVGQESCRIPNPVINCRSSLSPLGADRGRYLPPISRFHQSVRPDLALRLLSFVWCVGAGERAGLLEAA